MNWLAGFFMSVGSGVIASAIVLVADRARTKERLRRNFKAIEGTYMHYNLKNEPVPNGNDVATTHVKYVGEAKFEVSSTTSQGQWQGRIKMDDFGSDHGGGTFTYDEESMGSGVLEIIVLRDSQKVLVNARTLNFVGSLPAAYWWVKDEHCVPCATACRVPLRDVCHWRLVRQCDRDRTFFVIGRDERLCRELLAF